MELFFTESPGITRSRTHCILQSRTLKLIMRICYLNMFLLVFSFELLSSPTNGQGLEDINVTLEFNNEPLENALKNMEEQTGLLFAFPQGTLSRFPGVSLSKGTYTMKEALDRVLAGTGLKYRESENHVIIFLPSQDGQTAFTVTGKVSNQKGDPVPGVNILIKGTTKGTTTDAQGYYSIEVAEQDILVFTFIGFKVQEVQVSSRTVLDIALEEDITTLKEIEVNGGYYTTTKITSTGNIARVSAEEISKQPVVNPLQALQGRMPGVEIVQYSGVPGHAMQIRIRGQNSLRLGKDNPLYVIDGVPVPSTPVKSYGMLTLNGMDPLNTINPENIESIEVLKDADATAIYGSRGANGVVLITTKKAPKEQKGRTNLDISFYEGAGKANHLKNLMNSSQYLEMRREAFKNDNIIPSSNPSDNGFNGRQYAPDLTVWDTTRYTDWQEALFGGTAHIRDAQLALTGGNSTTSFRLSSGYHAESTVFPGNFGYKKLSSALNVDHKSRDNKFNVTLTANYGIDNNRLFDADMITQAINMVPVAPALYNEDGSLNWEIVDRSPTWINPMAGTLATSNSKSYTLITNALLQYEILQGLFLKTSLGYTRITNDEINITPYASMSPTFRSQSYNTTTVANSSSRSWIMEPQITYKRSSHKNRFNVVLGTSWQSSVSSHLSMLGMKYPSDKLLGDLRSAALFYRLGNTNSEYRYNAVFGRVSYDWDEKYLVNLTARRDGSSRFGPDKKFATFGAVGVGWVFSNERFIQNKVRFLSFGKVRASYGSAGSDAIGDYEYLATYTATNLPYQNVSGLVPYGLSNRDYAWEVVRKLEAGLELGLIQDRINLTASWFRNRSSNQLVGYSLPAVTGFTSITANLPATVQNAGWEFVLSTTNPLGKSVTWTSSLNLTVPRNKLVSYPGLEESAYSNQYVVGKSLSIAKQYHYLGVNPQTGLYEIEDVNGDGLFNITDRNRVTDFARPFYGGLNNTISCKGFELGFFFEFVKQKGAGRFYLFDYAPGKTNISQGNQPTDVLDRWRREGDVTNVQKFTQLGSNGMAHNQAVFSDVVYSDASFVRLKTISLGYTLPAGLMERTRLQRCRIYVQGQNLLTFTKHIGLDPQAPSARTLPALKMLTSGVQFGF